MTPRMFYVGPQWDESRNTSGVQAVPPDAVPKAHAAIARFRAEFPEHAAWIEAGYPRLSEAEHVKRFGVPYSPRKRSPRRPSATT